MKNFIPLILAILFIGAGCVFQKETPALGVEEPAVEEFADVSGVLEAFDETARVAAVRTATGLTDEVSWPADEPSPSDRLGAIVMARGPRDLSTLVIAAEAVDFPESQNLIVVSPAPGATVTSPLLVHGFGRAFEQTFSWRVKDAAGTVLDSGFAMTDARETGWFGPFSFEVFLPAMADQSFSLEVLEFSAKDGSEQNLVVVPLRLLSARTTTFSVFYSNVNKGSLLDCAKVFPVERTVAQTSAVGRAAIGELLKGPTAEERAAGYLTQIPPYAALNWLVISDQAAKADFTAGLEPGGGSCRVQAVRGEIEGTLLQFDTVETVVISVEGDSSTALQP